MPIGAICRCSDGKIPTYAVEATLDLDCTDTAILAALQHDGRMSIADLARTVHLSPSSTADRLRRLTDFGVITGYRAVDVRLGTDHRPHREPGRHHHQRGVFDQTRRQDHHPGLKWWRAVPTDHDTARRVLTDLTHRSTATPQPG